MHAYRWQVLVILLATVSLFLWSGASDMGLINGVGYSVLSDKLDSRAALGDVEPGLYAFPAPPAWSGDSSEEALEKWQNDYAAGPTGMLIIRPDNDAPFSLQKLLTAFVAQLLGVTLVSFIASRLQGAFWLRFALLAAIGPIAICAVSVIYWNWYAFPLAFFLAQLLDVTVGWTLVASIVAWLQSPRLAAVAPQQPKEAAHARG